MTEEEFESLISDQIQDAADYIDEQISSSRADAIKYYQGEKFGNEVEGRSQIVTRDVRDAVQSVLPSLLKIFQIPSIANLCKNGHKQKSSRICNLLFKYLIMGSKTFLVKWNIGQDIKIQFEQLTPHNDL